MKRADWRPRPNYAGICQNSITWLGTGRAHNPCDVGIAANFSAERTLLQARVVAVGANIHDRSSMASMAEVNGRGTGDWAMGMWLWELWFHGGGCENRGK
jgi:hypothetical protein